MSRWNAQGRTTAGSGENMNSSLISWLSRGLWAQAAALALATLLVYAVVALVATWLDGRHAALAAAVAAALCLAGAEAGLIVSSPFRKTAYVWQGSLLGMFPRLGIPFGFGAVLYLRGRPLAEAGLLYYLVGFYSVTLVFETALMLLTNASNTADRSTLNASTTQPPND